MNSLDVSKETFQKATAEVKLDILFDFAVANHTDIRALQKRKKFDTAISGFGGLIGGIIAVVGSKILWKP